MKPTPQEERLDDFSYDTVLTTINDVRKLQPILWTTITEDTAYESLMGAIRNLDQSNPAYKALSTIVEKTVQDLFSRLVEYNSQLSEIQDAIQKKEVVSVAEKAAEEEREQVVEMLKKIAGMGYEQRRAESQGKEGVANKAAADMERLIERTRDNKTITLLTQIFPTIADIDGYGEKMVENHKNQLRNIAKTCDLL